MKEEDNQFIMNILTDENKRVQTGMHRIVVAGTGYVGLSLAVLLSQYNQVTAVDIIPEKVKKLAAEPPSPYNRKRTNKRNPEDAERVNHAHKKKFSDIF